jgi:hypothetical protein
MAAGSSQRGVRGASGRRRWRGITLRVCRASAPLSKTPEGGRERGGVAGGVRIGGATCAPPPSTAPCLSRGAGRRRLPPRRSSSGLIRRAGAPLAATPRQGKAGTSAYGHYYEGSVAKTE